MRKNKTYNPPTIPPQSVAGVTLVELMVALAIGSFLIIGAVQVASQSRHAFRINQSIARVQETAQFAMDTLETDLRLASNWGMLSRGDGIAGRSMPGTADPLDLLPETGSIIECGEDWPLDLVRPIEGSNNSYTLPCGAKNDNAQVNSDTLTIRRVSVDPADPLALVDGRFYIQTTRTQGTMFNDAEVPAGYDVATSRTHQLLVNTYYVADDSELIPGAPTLRRKTLTGSGTIEDQEVAPGIENMQVQFGVDIDFDYSVDRYVNPGDAVLADPATRVMTARIWVVVRSIDPEIGIVDDRDYEPGDVDLGPPAADDQYRRLQVSKTILLRNARI